MPIDPEATGRALDTGAGGGRYNCTRGTTTTMITLLLIDDRPDVRQGLCLRLELEPDLIIVGEAADAVEGIALAALLRPDVVLLDVELPGLDGISAGEALRAAAPESAIVVLTIRDDALTRARAQSAGLLAFVGKHEAADLLLPAIRRAAYGDGLRDKRRTA